MPEYVPSGPRYLAFARTVYERQMEWTGSPSAVEVVAVDAVEQTLATILADYAITTRTQPRPVQIGEIISRLRMEKPALRLRGF